MIEQLKNGENCSKNLKIQNARERWIVAAPSKTARGRPLTRRLSISSSSSSSSSTSSSSSSSRSSSSSSNSSSDHSRSRSRSNSTTPRYNTRSRSNQNETPLATQNQIPKSTNKKRITSRSPSKPLNSKTLNQERSSNQKSPLSKTLYRTRSKSQFRKRSRTRSNSSSRSRSIPPHSSTPDQNLHKNVEPNSVNKDKKCSLSRSRGQTKLPHRKRSKSLFRTRSRSNSSSRASSGARVWIPSKEKRGTKPIKSRRRTVAELPVVQNQNSDLESDEDTNAGENDVNETSSMQLVLLDSPQIVDNDIIDNNVDVDDGGSDQNNLNQESHHEQINQLGKVIFNKMYCNHTTTGEIASKTSKLFSE